MISSMNLSATLRSWAMSRMKTCRSFIVAHARIYPTFFGPTNPPPGGVCIGCPVAVSDIYGMREQVGDAALLFDQRSVDGVHG